MQEGEKGGLLSCVGSCVASPKDPPAHRLGVAVTNFRLANNGTYEVQFHRIAAWRGLAEIAAKYLSKGRLVYVSGRLSSRAWTGRDGVQRWELEIIAEDIQFLSAKAAGYPAAAVAA